MDGAGRPSRTEHQLGCGPVEDCSVSLARPGEPRFGNLSTVEARILLDLWVYNLGSASALGEMISEICPLFFKVSLCLSFLFQNSGGFFWFLVFLVVVGFFFSSSSFFKKSS